MSGFRQVSESLPTENYITSAIQKLSAYRRLAGQGSTLVFLPNNMPVLWVQGIYFQMDAETSAVWSIAVHFASAITVLL